MVERESKIQREIHQQRPFRSLGHEGVIALLRTADQVRSSVARVIEPHGITPQQYNVLRILRGAGDTGLPTLEISSRMVERAPGITRLLDRLEVKHLVRRERCPEDRRQVLCYLTAAGRSLLAALDDPVDQADNASLAGLDHEEQMRLLQLLDAVRAGLG